MSYQDTVSDTVLLRFLSHGEITCVFSSALFLHKLHEIFLKLWVDHNSTRKVSLLELHWCYFCFNFFRLHVHDRETICLLQWAKSFYFFFRVLLPPDEEKKPIPGAKNFQRSTYRRSRTLKVNWSMSQSWTVVGRKKVSEKLFPLSQKDHYKNGLWNPSTEEVWNSRSVY